jgi:phosphoribosylaminoimidazole-succinocarboxamide synthase
MEKYSEQIKNYLPHVLADAHIPELPNHYRGKVRDCYDMPDNTRIIITSDRISAFDRILTTIPLKGQVLTQMARYWFEQTADICPNHVVSYPDPNVVIGRKLKIMPVEIVVRDYMTGSTGTSIWPMYKSGKREMYGIKFPDGLKENQKLHETIITPTSKAFDAGHDEPLSAAEIIEQKLLTKAQWDIVSAYALKLFARGRELAAKNGLILVDTKYEFGFDSEGNIILADEIHTPDSSRYWFLESYDEKFTKGERPESFDKDFVRNWVNSRCDPYKDDIPNIPDDIRVKAAEIYISAFERITGKAFEFPKADINSLNRIKNNLLKQK